MQGINPITMQCIYSTPCGYCIKWDKKCDKKIGCGTNHDVPKRKDPALEYIKSGKGLPPLNTDETTISGIRKETRG